MLKIYLELILLNTDFLCNRYYDFSSSFSVVGDYYFLNILSTDTFMWWVTHRCWVFVVDISVLGSPKSKMEVLKWCLSIVCHMFYPEHVYWFYQHLVCEHILGISRGLFLIFCTTQYLDIDAATKKHTKFFLFFPNRL